MIQKGNLQKKSQKFFNTHTHTHNPCRANVLFIIISETLRLIKDVVICILKLFAEEKKLLDNSLIRFTLLLTHTDSWADLLS